MNNAMAQQQDLQKWMGYVNYGQYAQFVQQQAMDLMTAFPNFKPSVEQYQFPGEAQANNLLMFKGALMIKNKQFPIKLILQNGFPHRCPKAYVDQNLDPEVIRSKNYLGAQNEIQIPYLQGWNMANQSNLRDLIKYLQSIMDSDPPVPSGVGAQMGHQSNNNQLFNQIGNQPQSQGAFNPSAMGQAQAQYQQPGMGQPNPYGQQYGQQQQNQGQRQQQPGLQPAPQQQPQDPMSGFGFGPKPGAAGGGSGQAAKKDDVDGVDGLKQQVIDRIDIMASDLATNAEETMNHLIDLKTRLHADGNKMEEAVEACQDQVSECQSSIQVLEKSNATIEKNLQVNSGAGAGSVTPDTIDALLTCPDPFSEKIVHLVSKYNALEDCMGALKKGFEKDAIPLSELLHHIRALSVKQCKKLQKMGKIDGQLNASGAAQPQGYGALPQQPQYPPQANYQQNYGQQQHPGQQQFTGYQR